MDELANIAILVFGGLILRFSLTLTGQAWAKSHAQTVAFMILPLITFVITKTISEIFPSIHRKAFHKRAVLLQSLKLERLSCLLPHDTISISNFCKIQQDSLNLDFEHLFFLVDVESISQRQLTVIVVLSDRP